MVRLPPVRAAIRNAKLVGGAYAATVLIGGQLVVLPLIQMTPSIGEAMQLHAWLGLETATLLAGWALVATITGRDYRRTGGAILGVTAGTTTGFLLLSGLIYFAYARGLCPPDQPTGKRTGSVHQLRIHTVLQSSSKTLDGCARCTRLLVPPTLGGSPHDCRSMRWSLSATIFLLFDIFIESTVSPGPEPFLSEQVIVT